MWQVRTVDWVREAETQLLRLARSDSGWGYRRGSVPCVEPTALACLALQATESRGENSAAFDAVRTAARWLASIQQLDGALGISASLSTPQWPTPFAVLTWASQEGFTAEMEKATKWLLKQHGVTFHLDPEVIGHDTTMLGWPWVAGTHSWLEPTAMALLALRRRGLMDHERTREGLRLILDRSIASGGWNYGNNSIYGRSLRPQPAVTGIALVALSRTQRPDGVVHKACEYLEHELPTLRSAQSLCWALLGLRAWGLRPSDARRWLAESFEQAGRHTNIVPELAYLLLASAERSLLLLGAI